MGTTGRKQSVNRQEQTTSNMDSNIKYEVTSHDQHNRYQMKRYMIKHTNVQLFSVVRFSPRLHLRWKKLKAIESWSTWSCFVLSFSRSLFQHSWLATSDQRVSRRISLMKPVRSFSFRKKTEWEFLVMYSNLTEIKSAIQLGKNRDFGNFNV